MQIIDQFAALTADGTRRLITIQSVKDDFTWFHVYDGDRLLGRIHWRADIDAYMTQRPNGETCGTFPALTDAEDALVHAARYDIGITPIQSAPAPAIDTINLDENKV